MNTVGDDLRLANLPTGKKCAAALTGTEFFLHSTDYTPYDSTATPSATTYLGYVEAPDCGANDMVCDGTGLGCRDAMTTGECKMLNQDFVFNMDADSMCRTDRIREFCLADMPHIKRRFANCGRRLLTTTKPRRRVCELRHCANADKLQAMEPPQIVNDECANATTAKRRRTD